MLQTLNKLYAEYLTGDLNRSDLEGYIYFHLSKNQDKTCLSHWKDDEYEDFISWFYPRIKKSIDLYQDIGSSFEAFIYKYILIASKEYKTRTVTNSVTEYSAWSARVPEMYAREEPPPYLSDKAESLIKELIFRCDGRKNPRQLLALILKCYYHVSEDFIDKIAPRTGINRKQLRKMIEEIRLIRQKKDDDLYNMKERIYCQYYRCMIYEKKLTYVKDTSTTYEKLKLQHIKARERLEKMRNRMACIRTEATNKQVAEVIGISKGTVDANLHKLKIKWSALSEKAMLN